MLSVVDTFFNDNRKIGIILITTGCILLTLGVVFLFDPALLAMGNILFIGGMPFVFGFMRCLRFFNPLENSSKWKGVVPFFGGVFLVLMKWPVFGMLLEMYGIIRLFGSYFPMIFTMLHQVPGLGSLLDRIPFIKDFVSSAAAHAPKYPNV
ncbi:uncharacterized protein [Blastocystis hominis]|uniref:Uncharacterized protein n=1 Tax=Blastocystis hominis TaxID=12968 RepID=D8LVB6_BLAHO|nr:uncharacterized protein [Blastocystis hominis]CBK19755.2 unnamed protein product [Blastocystis hominis]|eukprot:XP_012893803.1 uncharacterized protein [Blastocystis hominis]